MQISVAVICRLYNMNSPNEQNGSDSILWLSCCHLLNGMCPESEELNVTEVNAGQRKQMVKGKKEWHVCVHAYKQNPCAHFFFSAHTSLHAYMIYLSLSLTHTHTHVY